MGPTRTATKSNVAGWAQRLIIPFREEPAAFVEPDAHGPYPDGLHTLSAVGGITLVDGKRLQLAPAEFRRVIARMLRRRLRKVAYRLFPRPAPLEQ